MSPRNPESPNEINYGPITIIRKRGPEKPLFTPWARKATLHKISTTTKIISGFFNKEQIRGPKEKNTQQAQKNWIPT